MHITSLLYATLHIDITSWPHYHSLKVLQMSKISHSNYHFCAIHMDNIQQSSLGTLWIYVCYLRFLKTKLLTSLKVGLQHDTHYKYSIIRITWYNQLQKGGTLLKVSISVSNLVTITYRSGKTAIFYCNLHLSQNDILVENWWEFTLLAVRQYDSLGFIISDPLFWFNWGLIRYNQDQLELVTFNHT